LNKKKFDQFDAMFYPRSVAVVGASIDKINPGAIFLRDLLDSSFKGKVYPVNPAGNEIFGVRCYPKVSAIPGPVDYVLISVPGSAIMETLEDCAAKGVQVAQIFTAGFRELKPEGYKLEEEMVKIARKGKFRIFGPNCLGIYNPAINFCSWGNLPPAKAGPVAVIAQSGGVAFRTVNAGLARGIQFSRVISYGNACDLDSTDFLEYFAADPDTQIICLYMEGVRDGQRLLELLRGVCKTKPVIMWKGGRTEAGAEVTASHTGSLAASYSAWSALSRQANAVQVENLNELVDTLLSFYCLGEFKGRSLGFVVGFSDGGGSDSVSATDIFSSQGFEIPPFSVATLSHLQNSLPSAGTILRNPLDAGFYAATARVLDKILNVLTDDPGVDLVILQEYLHEMLGGTPWKELAQSINDAFIQLRKNQPKPVAVISAPGFPTTEDEWEIELGLIAAGIPVYPSLERAAKAIANVSQYYNSRDLDENQRL
jgi:acyl-CoA synthetase (NDP forming)